MRKILFLMVFLGTVGVYAQGDVVVRIGLDGVVLSIKQRGNLYQMLGYYAQLSSGLKYHYPDENLKKNIQEYDAILADFETFFPNEDIQKYVQLSRETWAALKPDLEASLSGDRRQNRADKGKLIIMLAQVESLASHMKSIQNILVKKSSDSELVTVLSATANLLESSAKLSTFYLLKVSTDSSLVEDTQKNKTVDEYKQSLSIGIKSDLAHAKIFKKRYKKIEKVYFFNIMVEQVTKTPIPSLVLKKNYAAYLSALINVGLITAASTEGKQKTMEML